MGQRRTLKNPKASDPQKPGTLRNYVVLDGWFWFNRSRKVDVLPVLDDENRDVQPN